MNFRQNLISAYKIYFGNMGILLPLALLPVLPFTLLTVVNHLSPSFIFLLAGWIISAIVQAFTQGAMIIAIDDISLGKPITAGEALGRISTPLAKQIFFTELLRWIKTILGFILLVIPGMIFLVRYIFAIIVVILEGVPYQAALDRSREITRGRAWAVFFHTFGMALPVLIVILLILEMFKLVLGMSLDSTQVNFAAELFTGIVGQLLSPLFTGFLLAMYLDLRGPAEPKPYEPEFSPTLPPPTLQPPSEEPPAESSGYIPENLPTS